MVPMTISGNARQAIESLMKEVEQFYPIMEYKTGLDERMAEEKFAEELAREGSLPAE